MTPPIHDAQARKDALDIERSFIVQAPAGSGKTELLIQRYLKLLAHVQRPEQILAMTFTRKAAGEMKNRVLLALDRARDATPPSEPHEQTTWSIARQALQNNERQGWRLLENPLRLKIQTIDSFCASLTRQTPLLSGMGSLLEIQEDSRDLFRKTAHEVLALVEEDSPAGTAVRAILRRLDNSKSRFLIRMVQLLSKRDQWMISFFESADEYRSREDQERILGELVESVLQECHATLPASLQEILTTLLCYSGNNIAASNPDHPLACLEALRDFPEPNIGCLPHWKAFVSLLLTNEGAPRKTVNKNLGFPPANGDEVAQEMKDGMLGVLDRLRGHPDLTELLAVVQILPNPRLSDEEWEFLENMFDLLPEINNTLRRVFAGEGKVDFSEISLSSLNSLKWTPPESGGTAEDFYPSELLEKLDTKLDHILVDEFQDTSFKQIALLKLLTHEWIPEQGNSLFLVGDPMQSIYRFRDAEVALFVKARKEGLGALPLAKLQLLTNFRSQQRVVDWVNQCFGQILPEYDDPDRGAISYAQCSAIKESSLDPGVRLHPIADSKSDEEAHRVVEVIQDIRKHHPEDSIALLVRARPHLLRIVQELQKNGIQFRAEEIDPLTSRPAILDLLALMRALISPLDRVSWLSILRAPWCGLSLQDLHHLCAGDRSFPVWDLLNQPDRFNRLSEDGQKRATRLIQILTPPMKLFPSVNFRSLLEGCWIALGGPACIDPYTAKDVQVFFDKVSEVLDGGDFDNLHNFETILNNLFANPSTGEGHAVQIMTIHKAKGLEFDFVLLPGLGRTPKGDENQLINWITHGDHLLFAPIPEAGEDASEIHNFLKQMDRERGRYETRRLLYVATTRTKKQLHLFGHVKTKKDGIAPEKHSMLDHLWSFIEEEWTAAHEGLQTTPESGFSPAQEEYFIKRLPVSFTLPEAPPALATEPAMDIQPEEEEKESIPFDWAANKARCLGNVLHRCFETITREGLEQWNDARINRMKPALEAALLAEGLSPRELQETRDKGIRALKNILKDKDGCEILKRHDHAAAEYALTSVEGRNFKTRIIDRTYIEKGVRWIIDYKTGEHRGGNIDTFFAQEKERYRKQLERYEKLLRDQGETRPIKKALYYPLHQRLVEILPE